VIAGDRLFIANQDSDRVSQILVDRERGKLHPAGPVLPFLAPTCLTLW